MNRSLWIDYEPVRTFTPEAADATTDAAPGGHGAGHAGICGLAAGFGVAGAGGAGGAGQSAGGATVALSGARETDHSHLPEWGTFAHRHLRSETDAGEICGQDDTDGEPDD